MISLIERALLAWLKRVAPYEWPDAVEGDLNEERETGRRRLWTIVQLSRIASRFTAEAAAASWRARRQAGRRTMTVGTDFRHAFRSLLRAPGFSSVAVTTLALAIGANTAIYSALSALVLNPLPFKDGNRFVFIWHKSEEMSGVMVTPPAASVEQWRSAGIFERIEAYATRSEVMTGEREPMDVSVSTLSPSALETFGIQPMLGRAFGPSDYDAASPPVVLIGHALWRSSFSSDPNAVGRTITLGGKAHTVIGVMPRRFRLAMGSDEMWAPARKPAGDQNEPGEVVAKLAPGVSIEQAQAALDKMPDVEGFKGWKGIMMPPSESTGTAIRTALMVLTGAVGVLLLIACVNVANLMLSRHSSRRREIAVRHALGASRGRLARYLMIESLLLAIAGGAAGLIVANVALRAISAIRPDQLEILERLALEPDAFFVAAALTIVTGLVFGAGPALSASRANLQDVIKTGGRTSTGSGQRVRAMLTVAQVSLALMLLVGATLLLKSYAKLTAVDPGYNPNGILSVKVALPAARYPAKEEARRQAFYDQVLESVRAIPGVKAAAIGNGIPPETGVMIGQIEIEGAGAQSRDHKILAGGYITPGYFETLGIPMIEGRTFTDQDTFGRDPVVIVGETFAKRFWPDGRVVGRKLRLQTKAPWSTVVGVVRDVKAIGLATGASKNGELQLYHPRAQMRAAFGAIIVRTGGNPRAVAPAIKQAVWAQDPLLPIREIATANELLAKSTSQWRFNFALLAVLAGCGLTLAIVGVYGVTSLFVGQRHREVGIRMALGATRAAVAALVMRQTMMMLGIALVIGTGGALWLSRYLRSLVFETATTDAVSFASAAAGIAVAALAATIVPLRRATAVDPAVVLRSE